MIEGGINEEGSALAAGGQELGRFFLDAAEVICLRLVWPVCPEDLLYFALAHQPNGLGHAAQDRRFGQVGQQGEGGGKQMVACQDGDLISP